MAGYLDKTSAQEAQRVQDELLLCPDQCALHPDPEVESTDDDDTPPSSAGPIATPPSCKRNVSVPTPGVCRSIRLQVKEKETANLVVKDVVIKPHCLSDLDPFDKLLDDHHHIDDLLSNLGVIVVI